MSDREPLSVDRVRERPGGRSEEVRERVLRAARELTGEKAYADVTVSELAERSGVARSTIHRRWGDVLGVMADVAASEIAPSRYMERPEEADVRAWAFAVRDGLPTGTQANPFEMVLQHLRRLPDAEARRAASLEVLRRLMPIAPDATDPGELRDLIDLVFAPIYLAYVMGLQDTTDEAINRYVDRYVAELERRKGSDRAD